MSFIKSLISRGRQHEDRIHNDTLSSMAVHHASVNVTLLVNQIQQTITDFLTAIYSLDAKKLPMEHMEEAFYYQSIQQIYIDKCNIGDSITDGEEFISKRTDKINIKDLRVSNYDNSLIYAVRSITYSSHFFVQGVILTRFREYLFENEHQANFTFLNDSRLGWILSSVEYL